MSNSLWVEKYRPTKLEDCALPEKIKSQFKGFIESKELPNLLLHGSAGIGKTTLAKVLATELGYDVLFLNASSERGIDVLRTTITQFASTASIDGNKKMVILDEFDMASTLLQGAMRSAIEDFSQNTRFVFTCNYPNKIIKAIHSRCAVFDFNIKGEDKLDIVKQVFNRVKFILDTENIEYDRGVVAEVVKQYFPDFRRIINECQRIASISGVINDSSVIANDVQVDNFVKLLKEKNFKGARLWIAETLVNQDVNTIFRAIYDSLYEYLEPPSIPEAVLLIATYQNRCINSADPEIQFAAFAVEAMVNLQFKD